LDQCRQNPKCKAAFADGYDIAGFECPLDLSGTVDEYTIDASQKLAVLVIAVDDFELPGSGVDKRVLSRYATVVEIPRCVRLAR
jgi:hypothetical protein